MYETIALSTDGRGVATLRLNRPDKHNAMSGQMMDEVQDACAVLAKDDSRVVVLTGEGKSFCAGGDLRWMQDQIAADGPTRAREAAKIAYALQALNTLPKPVIGRINGNALGGGVGMASVCDVAVASSGTKFGLTEVRLGLIPATIGPYVIARMGEARARRVFFSARIFSAEEARELGLVARVAAPEDLDAAVEAEVLPYLSCAPGAVADAKALARRLGPRIDAEVIYSTIADLVARWEDEEAMVGIKAFFAKETPPWQE